jgi:hypothetical protein
MYITSFHDSYGISVPQLVEDGSQEMEKKVNMFNMFNSPK